MEKSAVGTWAAPPRQPPGQGNDTGQRGQRCPDRHRDAGCWGGARQAGTNTACRPALLLPTIPALDQDQGHSLRVLQHGSRTSDGAATATPTCVPPEVQGAGQARALDAHPARDEGPPATHDKGEARGGQGAIVQAQGPATVEQPFLVAVVVRRGHAGA